MQIFTKILLLTFPVLLYFKGAGGMDNEHRPHQLYVRMRNGSSYFGYIHEYNHWEVISWLRPHEMRFVLELAFVRLQLRQQYHQYWFLLIRQDQRDEHAVRTPTSPHYVVVTIEGHTYVADEFVPYNPDNHRHHAGTREDPERGNYPAANHVYVNMGDGSIYRAPFVHELLSSDISGRAYL